MAKLLTNVLVTLESNQGMYRGMADAASVSSMNGGFSHDVAIENIRAFKVQNNTPNKTKEDKVPRGSGPVTQTPVLSPEAERMVRAAKDNERARLDAAAGLLDAQREAQQTILDAEHRLNRAMLDFFHTGKTDLDADAVLAEAGFTELEERTGSVYNLDTEVLYPSAE
jgi:hypothetical protein